VQLTADQIEKDLGRTFPNHPAMDAAGRATLRRLLNAYSCHHPAVGYCQGMNFLGGLLLLFMPEEAAFWSLSVLVDDLLEGYFVETMAGAVLDQRVVRRLLQQHFPTVSQHADSLQVDVSLIASQWCAPRQVATFLRTSPSSQLNPFPCTGTGMSQAAFVSG
jgi:hypothetical protein